MTEATANGTSLARDNTMVATAKEGVAFLHKEGADDLIKLQGLEHTNGKHTNGTNGTNGNHAAEANGNGAADSHESAADKADANGSSDHKMEDDAPPQGLPQHRTIVETTKEAEHLLAGETLAETRAATEELKDAVASSSPPQKSRTMVETAKIGQALLGAEANLLGETRNKTAETKEAAKESTEEAKEVAEKAVAPETAETVEEVEPEKEDEEPKAKSPAKKTPAKKTPKASPAAKKQKVEKVVEPAEEEVVEEKEVKERTTPRKRGGRPSMVDTLLQEAQKFAGNSAGDVKEGRTTRRSRGAEPEPAPAPAAKASAAKAASSSPAKRGRPSRGKGKADDADEADD